VTSASGLDASLACRVDLHAATSASHCRCGASSCGDGREQRPLDAALPRLSALTPRAPSPLLRWQLPQLLYAYCAMLRLYNGDYRADATVRGRGGSELDA